MMIDPTSGIDPGRLEEMSEYAGELSSSAEEWLREAQTLIKHCDLQDMAFSVVDFCAEVHVEMETLSKLASRKAEEIQAAADGGYCAPDDMEIDRLMSELESSLHNDIGVADVAQTAELDPEYADILSEFDSADDFIGPKYREAVKSAMEEGDLEKVQVLTDAHWDYVGSLSDEDAAEYLRAVPPEIMVITIAESGIPPIRAVVKYATHPGDFMNQHTGVGGGSSPVDDELSGLIKTTYGIDSRHIDDVPNLFADKLSDFADESSGNSDLLISAAGADSDSGSYAGAKPVAAVVRRVAIKNPSMVAHKAAKDDKWTQNFSDLVVQGATDAEVSGVLDSVSDFAAEDLILNEKDDGGYTDPNERVRAVGRLDKCIRAADHGIRLNYGGIFTTLVGELPAGKTVNKVLGAVKEDDLHARREAQTNIDMQMQNRALDLLCRTEPDKAKRLLDKMGVDPSAIGGLTPEDWEATKGMDEELGAINTLMDQLAPAYTKKEG